MNLAELRAIQQAATPGPWYAKANDLIGGWCVGTCKHSPNAHIEYLRRVEYESDDGTPRPAATFASCIAIIRPTEPRP